MTSNIVKCQLRYLEKLMNTYMGSQDEGNMARRPAA